MFQGGKVSWTIFYMLLPFIIYSFALFFYPLSGLTAERIIRTPSVQNGGKAYCINHFETKISFSSALYSCTEKIANREIATPAGGNLKHFFVFGFRNKMEWEYEIEQMPRGEHILEGVEIEVSDFFGWVRKTAFHSR